MGVVHGLHAKQLSPSNDHPASESGGHGLVTWEDSDCVRSLLFIQSSGSVLCWVWQACLWGNVSNYSPVTRARGAQDQSINLDVCLVTFIIIHLSRGQKSMRDPWHSEVGEEGLQFCISQNKVLLQCQFSVLPRSWVLLSSLGLRDSGF